jgi:hypothetical protein
LTWGAPSSSDGRAQGARGPPPPPRTPCAILVPRARCRHCSATRPGSGSDPLKSTPRQAWGRVALLALLAASPATAGRLDPAEEAAAKSLIEYWQHPAPPNGGMKGRTATPAALPDITGPGAVLTVGNVAMKVTNFGTLGNPFVTSSDPSGQWPGASGSNTSSPSFSASAA